MANDVPFGLASLRLVTRPWSGDADVEIGSTSAAYGSTLNSRSLAEMPHGGFKQTGYGKNLSMYGSVD